MLTTDITINGITVGSYSMLEEFEELLKRYEALDEERQKATLAFIEANGCNLKEAVPLVESGAYEFYSDMNLEEVAEKLVNEGRFGNLEEIEAIVKFIDYVSLGRKLVADGYTETSQGVIYSY